MRILIAPRPKNWGGPGIFLKRVAKELHRRGYNWTAFSFHYAGFSLLPWQYAFMMGCPRYVDKILRSGKPVITTMGKPESPDEHKAVGRNYFPEYEQLELQMARVIMKSDKVVFISHYVKDIWKKIFQIRGFSFPSEQNVRVIHHGVDTNLFSPAKEPPKTPFVLGSVGALREKFRLVTLFSVSRLLEFEHRLLIVGSMNAESKDIFDKAMQNTELLSRTTYIPWVDAEALPDYYRQMHCLFHPVDYEGLGIVIAEALACGVPVVVPAHGAPKEFILPAGGIAVETKQFTYDEIFSNRMAKAVTYIYKHWDDFAKGARKQAINKISIDKIMDAYLDFMELPRYAGSRTLKGK